MLKSIAFGIVLATMPVVVLAGTPVPGQGSSVKEALGDTAKKSWDLAVSKNTCVTTMPSLETCKKYPDKDNLWECKAVVANNKGSCGGDKNWFKKNKPMFDLLIEAGKVATTGAAGG
jgi:hypothetical protein